MEIWLIVLQADDSTWIEAAWDDNMTADNHSGWQEEVGRCRKLAFDNGYDLRIAKAKIAGIYEMFDHPDLKAELISP